MLQRYKNFIRNARKKIISFLKNLHFYLKVRADNSTDKITYVFGQDSYSSGQDYIRLREKLHIKTHYFDDVRPRNG